MSRHILQTLWNGISCHGFVGKADTVKTPRLEADGGGLA